MSDSTTVLVELLSLAAKASVLLLLAASLDRLVLRRHASAATRHLLWSVTLGAALVLPVATWLLPALDVPLPAFSSRTVTGVEQATHTGSRAAVAPRAAVSLERSPSTRQVVVGAEFIDGRPVATSRTRASSREIERGKGSSPLANLALGLYVAVALLLLGRVAAEQRLVRRIERGATPLRDVEWDATLLSTAGALGIRRPVAMLLGAANTMPLTWGVHRPAVLLPSSATAWSESRRRAVLLHELAHVTRFDCLTQTLAAITGALYWPHPGIWWASSRLRIERELACDDQALLAGVGAHDYAGHLLEIARLHFVPSGLRALAVSMASRSHLETRLLAAIDGARRRTAPSAVLGVLAVTLAAVLLMPLAALRGDTSMPAPTVIRASSMSQIAPVASSATTAPRVASATTPAPALDDTGDALVHSAMETAPPPRTSNTVTASASPTFEGAWAIRLANASEAERGAPTAHVMLWDPGMNTFYMPLAAFDGLSASQISGSTPGASFRLRRDAGTFAFTGAFAGGQGRGRFVFTPDPAFADSLERRGLERPTPAQQFSLGRHDVGFVLLDELARHGYPRPSTASLLRAGLTGADDRYVREMSAVGYRLGSVEALMSLSNQGVTPTYVREMTAIGYRGLSASELIRLRNHSLDAERVRSYNARAGRRLGVDELVVMRNRGDAAATDSPAPSRTSRPTTYETPLEGRWEVTPTTSDPFVWLEVFWTDDTNWKRSILKSELRGLAAEQIGAPTSAPVRFSMEQDAGRFEFDGAMGAGRGAGRFRFVPNRDFVSTLRSLGVRETGELTDHTLKNLTWGGMSASSIRAFTAMGIAPLTLNEVTDLAIRTVHPEYVRAMRDAGVTELNTVPQVTELAFARVPSEYARELAARGYRGLTGRQLIDLWRAGVRPSTVRDASDRLPTVEELLQQARDARDRGRRARP